MKQALAFRLKPETYQNIRRICKEIGISPDDLLSDGLTAAAAVCWLGRILNDPRSGGALNGRAADLLCDFDRLLGSARGLTQDFFGKVIAPRMLDGLATPAPITAAEHKTKRATSDAAFHALLAQRDRLTPEEFAAKAKELQK